ncbi:MAG: hypothetical protein ACI8RN_002426 [Glaciecola sp.]|jgi:hypothetical protein|uniref:DUF6502 family protein n=1 Tax=Congregibacter sp. TaxID=2744308 RepID=UPI0039E4D276
MSNDIQNALSSAIFKILKPLARVMLHHGMAYGSFAELARKAFVDESLEQLRRSGKRSSISSVAAMTGLTRKEASRLAALDIDTGLNSDRRYNRAVRVITGWTVDPRFLDSEGQPGVLPMQGDHSFELLVKKYSGDVPVAAMLSALESSGTVVSDDRGVQLLERAYLPTQTPAASINILGNDVAEIITSIDHNLIHKRAARVFQRKVSNGSISASALEEFKQLSNRKSQELLEDYHAWLTAHEIHSDIPTDSTESARYVSVGIYYYDDTIHEDPRS